MSVNHFAEFDCVSVDILWRRAQYIDSYQARNLWRSILPFCQLSVVGHILTSQILSCWGDGALENLKRIHRNLFFVLPSSLFSHRHTALDRAMTTKHSSKPSDP